MKEKSIMEGVMMVLGIILGFVIWVWGLLFSLLRTLWKTISGESVPHEDVASAGAGARSTQASSTASQGAESTEAGESAGMQGARTDDQDTTDRQHGDLGGISVGSDFDASFEEGGLASAREGGLSQASNFSTSRAPYDADVSTEGVVLNYDDATDRQEDVPLDEGIPNLGEPADIADTGPETTAEEAVVDQVESDVPEEYGQDTEIDSVETEDAWVADAPGEEDEIPAASRGLLEYGEDTTDEVDIEDMSDTETFGLYEEVDPSTTGGEVDLENDESPSWGETGLSIVDDPDEPLSADATGPLNSLEEETLGLRDSESLGVNDEDDSDSGRSTTRGEHLGVTGNFTDADATERLHVSQGEPGPETDRGAMQNAFATGDGDRAARRDTPDTGDTGSGEYGGTGEFGAPTDGVDRSDVGTSESDVSVSPSGETSAPSSDEAEDAADTGADTSETPSDDDHLGISGDFDEADDTQTVPAAPADGDTSTDTDASPESFTTGDNADAGADQDTSSSMSGRDSSDDAGYSAAWSTPAGVLDEWPNQAEGATGFKSETSGGDVAAAVDQSDISAGHGRERPDEDADSNAGQSAGQSGQITAGAEERASGGGGDLDSSFIDELSGGDPADLAAASAGDLGAVTSPAPDEQGVSRNDTGPDASMRSDEERRAAQGGGKPLPAGAVAGDGAPDCPADYPIKGNASSHIYHRPSDASYGGTIPEYCFATENDAEVAGYRAPRGRSRAKAPTDADADTTNNSTNAAGSGVSHATYTASSGGAAPETGSDHPDQESGSRKSRKPRNQQSDWVPNGAVKGDGNPVCPADYPIKGNANSRIYHRPSDSSYEPTIPEYCFATEEDAKKAGFRAPRG